MAEGRLTTPWMKLRICTLLAAAVVCSSPLSAQLGSSAARVLGQPDFRQNGFNSPESVSLFAPSHAALDARAGKLHVYVTDRSNRRVLGWLDLAALESGAEPDLVLGQLDLTRTGAFGIGAKGFSDPTGIAVDPSNGDVYVADAGANRVTRYRDPFDAAATLEPDNVYGQLTFTSTTANPGGVSAGTLRGPSDLAFDADGNLWISDTLNHRVLGYTNASLDDETPIATVVLGQFDFGAAGINAGGSVSAAGLRNPAALAFGPAGTLYVADSLNSRVLAFDGPFSTGKSASRVIGQTSFTTSSASAAGLPWSLRRVNGLAVSAEDTLYAAMREDNRVLVFENAAAAIGQQNATSVLGQEDTDETLPNSGTAPKASATGLFSPGGVALGPNGSVVIADTENNRVMVYGDGISASLVLGQADFTANSANRADGVGVGAPMGLAIDYSTEGFPLYASDSLNHLVLAWSSTLRFANGAPADLVIGQIGFNAVFANSGSTTPSASSLDTPKGLAITSEGDLFVADSGNNRVLRFRRPFDQNGKPQANVVLGQSAFFTKGSAFVNAGTTISPSDVEIGPDGRIYVADTGNNLVLEFAPGSTNGVGAVRVFGQPDTQTGALAGQVSGGSLNSPVGIGVDTSGILYVADTGNHRVLLFPLGPEVPTAGSNASKVVGQANL
ncbi:MAG: NHL repeat-containing protein [Acidobacteria bacterium]|nr:NHL repeat-containing protein [Acidobacteriota bacterium]